MGNEACHQSPRLDSIDILRGLIIVLMALDHSRAFWSATSFSPTDLAQTDWSWFFTRWITHFCAPLFIFLTGVSAFLYGQKVKDKTQLRNFLFSRGVWLIILEIAIITPSWQISYNLLILQVMWAIGCSMILLSLLIYLSNTWILIVCVPFLLFHNAFDDQLMMTLLGSMGGLWTALHLPGLLSITTLNIQFNVAYPIVPWFSVMSIGYVTAHVYNWSQPQRIQFLTRLGIAITLLFMLLRATNFYGDNNVFETQSEWISSVMSFLNTHKYPPSLQYLCMTLGPGLVLLAQLERLVTSPFLYRSLLWLKVFGSVPLFFYVVHVPIINVGAHLYTWLQYGEPLNLFFANNLPSNYQANLTLSYLVWMLLIAILYYPCKQYAALKRRSNRLVLSYL